MLPHYCGPDNSISRHFLSLEDNSALTAGMIVFVHSSIQALVNNKDKKILTDMISMTNCNYMLLSGDILSSFFLIILCKFYMLYNLKTGRLKSNRNEIRLLSIIDFFFYDFFS